MDDDQFPIDKPELLNAAASRFRETQEKAVVRDLTASLREREADVARLRMIRDSQEKMLDSLRSTVEKQAEELTCLKARLLRVERAMNTFGQEAFWVTRPSTRFSGSVDWVWSHCGSPIEFVRETLENENVSAGG